MHNDEPTLLDSLDRTALVEEVGEAVAHCEPPQVFGVHGDWGLGKTSFLHQVQWYLTGDCPQQPEAATKKAPAMQKGVHGKTVRAVWFDAWRYQNEDVPVVALLQEMRMQLSWRRRAARSVSRYANVAARGALIAIDGLTKEIGKDKYSKLRQANREWEATNLATALPSYTLREHLREAIDQLLPRRQKDSARPRLAVFIDDLDRCDPESAYRLLEGLKIYLTLENCVFVLGMNQKAIEEAIGSRMETVASESQPQRAAAYMEKLCQNVWRLPAVRRPGDVLDNLLETTVESADVRTWIRNAVEVDDKQCLPPNPRRLKGLANLIGRLSELLPTKEGQEDNSAGLLEAQLLVVVAYVYQFHQDLYVRWESDSGLYQKIWEWCSGNQDPNLPFLESMVLPQRETDKDSDQRDPTTRIEVEREVESTYPDPTGASVFWIQPLIRKLGNNIDPERFDRYLHGVST